ncbi:hypothetical protein [Lacrimispora sp.]|uniref:hypothetical protein n=1 Tax=Lacrimispora sp. TaxID=2719234 RepID=UPI003460455D
MGAKKLYALYTDRTKIGEYSSREIAELLKMRQVTVSYYANTGILYKDRCPGQGEASYAIHI